MSLTALPPATVTLAFTGASGLPYGIRMLEQLLAAGCRVWLLYSPAAQVVAQQEMQLSLPSQAKALQALWREQYRCGEQLSVFGREEWRAVNPRHEPPNRIPAW
jgi:4-hydroxy-3-polyprenylbenzoate decarboxylase